MTLSQVLATHLASTTYDDLPPAAVEAAKRSLLDAIGVSLGASGLESACTPFIEQAMAGGGSPESAIFGYRGRVPAAAAAFANGALAHALDFEDAYDDAPVHPNAAVIPAALAVAQARENVDGRDLITAVAVGCDLVCRVALCVRTPAESNGWYPPPIYGALGAIAAAGKIMNLAPHAYLDAFSLGLSQIACSGEIKYNPQSVMRAVRDAFPAQAGVLSSQLAKRGVAGFNQPFEGECGFFRLFVNSDYDEAILTEQLGGRFLGADVSFKPWPSCRGTHAFIEAALDLMQEHEIVTDEIVRIDLSGAPFLEMLMEPFDGKWAPTTAIDAKFSLPFVVATALTRGNVELADFSADALQRRDVRDLARRVRFQPIRTPGHQNAAAGALRLILSDGRQLDANVMAPRGSITNPMSWNDLVNKAAACAAHAHNPVDVQAIQKLAETVRDLETKSDAGNLVFSILNYSE